MDYSRFTPMVAQVREWFLDPSCEHEGWVRGVQHAISRYEGSPLDHYAEADIFEVLDRFASVQSDDDLRQVEADLDPQLAMGNFDDLVDWFYANYHWRQYFVNDALADGIKNIQDVLAAARGAEKFRLFRTIVDAIEEEINRHKA